MNAAMEMLRSHAKALYELVERESAIKLEIDPIETTGYTVTKKHVEATAHISKRCNAELSKCMNESVNVHNNLCVEQLNLLTKEQSKLKVWIYNVSHQEYTLRSSLIRKLAVPACPEDEEYAVVTSLPAVVIQPKPNIENYDTEYFLIDGRRVAMDLINPSNLGVDLDVNFDWLAMSSAIGNDFSKRGVFFSTHNPPLKKELKSANKRLKAYYIDLVDRANIVRITSAAATLGVPTTDIAAAVDYIEGKHSTK
jgi:hypothetical protein